MLNFSVFIFAIIFQTWFISEARYLLIDVNTENQKKYPQTSSNVFRSGQTSEEAKGILTKICIHRSP